MREKKSGFAAFVMFFIAIALFAVPNFVELSTLSEMVCLGFGIMMVIAAAVAFVILKYMVLPNTDIAFVRSGQGKEKVISKGWGLVIPGLHKKRQVNLDVRRFNVENKNQDGLFTKDSLRVDIEAQFFVAIPKDDDSILTAATILGEMCSDDDKLRAHNRGKFEGALRDVVIQYDFEELLTKREAIIASVKETLTESLKTDGLLLNDVAISKIDQTDPSYLSDTNSKDVQGRRTLASRIEKTKVETNKIEREAQLEMKQKDVETEKAVNAQNIALEEDNATREQKIKNARAKAEADTAKFAEEQELIAEEARISKEKNMAIAQTQSKKATEEADVDKEISLTEKRKEKAAADTERANAEKEAVVAEARVQTAKEIEIAERGKKLKLIDEETKAEASAIDKNKSIDVQAYGIETMAKAEKAAATDKAEAEVIKADAQKRAKILEAEGQKATAMIPVEVDKAKVEVKKAEVEVVEKELSVKAKYEEVSVGLEVKIKSLDVQEKIGVAQANAVKEGLANADLRIFGDTGMMTQMMNSIMGGENKGMFWDSFNKTAPKGIGQAMLQNQLSGENQAAIIKGAIESLPADAKEMLVKASESMTGGVGLSSIFAQLFGREGDSKELGAFEEALNKVNTSTVVEEKVVEKREDAPVAVEEKVVEKREDAPVVVKEEKESSEVAPIPVTEDKKSDSKKK